MSKKSRGGGYQPAQITIDGVDLEDRLAELGARLDAIRALAETNTGDVAELTSRLASVRSLAELGRMGRKKRAERQLAEPWRIHARDVAVAAAKANPATKNADLVRKIVASLKSNQIKGRDPRTIERYMVGLRGDGTLPPRKSK
jgi:hypothetical protein